MLSLIYANTAITELMYLNIFLKYVSACLFLTNSATAEVLAYLWNFTST